MKLYSVKNYHRLIYIKIDRYINEPIIKVSRTCQIFYLRKLDFTALSSIFKIFFHS